MVRKRANIDRHEDAGFARAPARPTAAVPGSPEKVEVLMRRAKNREGLFHPADAPHPAGTLVWEQRLNGAFVVIGSGHDPEEEIPFGYVPPCGFAGRLKQAREKARLDPKVLASRAGITRAALSYLENGHREPTLAVLVALADALRLGIDELLGRRVPSRN